MSKTTKKILILASILIVVSASIFSFMVYKVTDEGALLTHQIEELKKEQAQESSYYSLQKLAEESRTDRELLRSYFLESDSDGIDFLNYIESIAPQTGVILNTVSVDTIIEKEDNSDWIKATFSLSADRDEVQNFIKILETLPHVLRVNTVDLRSFSDSIWKAEVTIQVRLLNYDE